VQILEKGSQEKTLGNPWFKLLVFIK